MTLTHPGNTNYKDAFCIMRIRSAKTAFLRAITEAVLQRKFKGTTLLNSKQEYNSCLIPGLEAPSIREKRRKPNTLLDETDRLQREFETPFPDTTTPEKLEREVNPEIRKAETETISPEKEKDK